MIYSRTVIVPSTGPQQTVFDMTLRCTQEGCGTETFDVEYRIHDHLKVSKTKLIKIEGFPSKKYEEADLIFLTLYGILGEERCKELLKKMKKGVGNAKTKRRPYGSSKNVQARRARSK